MCKIKQFHRDYQVLSQKNLLISEFVRIFATDFYNNNTIMMTKKLFIGMIFAMAALTATAADKKVKAADENVSFTGRVETLADGSVRYDWVGVYMQTQFTGSKVAVDISDTGTSYYNVFIDGELKEKIKVTGKERHTIVLADKLKKGTHTLRLQKCTEGEYGCTTVYALSFDQNAQLSPVAPKERLIEVYGDSYTVGYGTEGKKATERFTLETENCNMAYTCIIARYFGADYRICAHSGNGMVRNYGDKNQESNPNMSTRSTQLYDQFSTEQFDFNWRRPDIVMINLGTNDFSPKAIPEADNYVNAYIKMIEQISERYDNVPILCITPHSANRYLRAALNLLRERTHNKYANVHFAESMLNIINDDVDLGNDWHPNYQGQCKIAMSLIPQISKLLHWGVREF